jgi:hypothetical protein
LKINGQPAYLPFGSAGSIYLSTIPSEFLVLHMMSRDRCKAKSTRHPASADVYGITTKIQRAQDSLNDLAGDSQEKCPACLWAKELNRREFTEQIGECTRDICKSSAPVLPDYFAEAEKVAALEEKGKSSMDPAAVASLQAVAKKVRTLSLESMKKYRKMLDSPPMQISDFDTLTFYQNLVSKVGGEFATDEVTVDNGKTTFYHRLRVPAPEWAFTQSELSKQITQDQVQDIVAYLDWQANDPGWGIVWVDTPEASLERMAPAPTKKESVQIIARGLLAQMEAAGKLDLAGGRSRETLFPNVDRSFLERAAATGDIEIEEIQKLVYMHNRVYAQVSPLKSEETRRRLLAIGRQVLSSPQEMAIIKSDLDKSIAFEESVANGTYDKKGYADPLENAIAACGKAFAVKTQLAPTDQDINETKVLETELRANLEKNVIPRFSHQTAEAIRAAAKTWDFRYPPQKDELTATFNREVREKVQWSDHLTSIALREAQTSLINDFHRFCSDQEVGVRPVFDAAETTAGFILMSRESAKSRGIGRPVMAHEFGHLISGVFRQGHASEVSKGRFKDARRCLTSKHAEPARALIHLGSESFEESQFAEEDWADLIAHVASPENKINPWCLFYKGKREEAALQRLYQGPHEGDTHSTILFRLLHMEQLNKNELPASCTRALASAHAQVDFSLCL